MLKWRNTTTGFLVLILVVGIGGNRRAVAQAHPPITEVAEELNKSFASPDVARWVKRFEREGREVYDKRVEIVDLMGLTPGTDVAEIGAGSGFFARLMAQRVAPSGTVYAVDISKPFVAHIAAMAKEMGLENVTAVLGKSDSPKLAENSVDVVFIVDSYHHFEHPYTMLAEIKKALRPGGVFFLIDFERIHGVTRQFVWNMVRAGKGTFTDEIIKAGFKLVEEINLLEAHYMLKFKHHKTPYAGAGK